MEHITRIDSEDTLPSVITKLCEGNMGAVNCLAEVFAVNQDIDPLNSLRGASTLLTLDNLGIYGSGIWILYKDVCKQKAALFIAVLRATQLGILRGEDVVASSVRTSREIKSTYDPMEIYQKVKEELGFFDPDNTIDL